ncbi:hypothetical protein ABK040_010110 [Willaertia magna]
MKLKQHGNNSLWKSYLFKTVREGTIQELEELLFTCRSFFDINIKDDNGMTILHHACTVDNIEKVISILSLEDIDKNTKDKLESTPLHHAVMSGCKDTVIYLCLDQGVFKEARNCYGDNPLHLAIKTKRYDIAKDLIEYGRMNIHSKRSLNSQSCMHIAAQKHDLDGIIFLERCGLHCNTIDADKCTPLMVAIKSFNDNLEVDEFIKMRCICYLLGKENFSTLMNQTDNNGRNCIHIAALYNTYSFFQLLALYADQEIYHDLLLSYDNERKTSLHLSCSMGYHKIAKLITSMARTMPQSSYKELLNMKDKEGNTAAHCTSIALMKSKDPREKRHLIGIIKLFFEENINWDAVNTSNQSCYQLLLETDYFRSHNGFGKNIVP